MAIDSTTRIFVTSPDQTTGKLDGTEYATTLGEILDANDFDTAEREDFTSELQQRGEFRIGGGAAAFFINRVIGQRVSVDDGLTTITGEIVEGAWQAADGDYDLDSRFLVLCEGDGALLWVRAPWACDVTVID